MGDRIEYLGLILLVCLCIGSLKLKNKFILVMKVVIFALFLTIGAYMRQNSPNVIFTIFTTSLVILIIIFMSNCIIFSRERIKLVLNALLIGVVFNCIIGGITGTLGFFMDSQDSIIGILFLSGFQIKNYCGGFWLLILILNYLYYFMSEKINSIDYIKMLIVSFTFLILSGSKAAVLLGVVFLMVNNLNIIKSITRKYSKLAIPLIVVMLVIVGIYLYNNVFSNITTYAYRIRGLQKIFEIMHNDPSRFWFGFSDIAYGNSRQSYTINMRNFLGWEASIEMAYVNILIKNGVIGLAIYIYVYVRMYRNIKYISIKNSEVYISLLLVMLISGFVETYMVSIHYIFGPVMYCLISGFVYEGSQYNRDVYFKGGYI